MNKRKLLTMAMALCMVAILAIGGSLAYFTDTDAQINTFTTGNVKIDLFEDFGGNTGIEKLLPATGSAQAGTLKNGVNKEVYVTNTGSEDAYVRVHIAIPQRLDNGNPEFNAGKNVLHFNYAKESIGKDKWDWSKAADDGKYEGDWNYYETTIHDIVYNVYVVTYTKALTANETTIDAMDKVYLDSGVTNEEIDDIKETLGDQWYIYVVAEGAQAAGFDNAYDALNASFGTPGATNYTAPDFTAGATGYKGETFKTWTSTKEQGAN